jgi:hypothetical protein
VATSTGPYAVALGTVLELAPAQATGVYFSVVQIVNSSPFLATVMVGGNQFLLQPFMADLYVLPTGGQPVSAMFSQVPGGSPVIPAGAQGSFCTATWYLPSDQITDAFPIALTAAALASAISGIVIVSQVPPEFISILNAAAPTAPWSVQIAGIAGKILSLFYITVCPGNVTGSICGIAMQSTATSVPVLNFVFNTGDSPVPIPYGGFQLPIGEGLEFSVAGSSGQMSAVICYSQA